MARAGSRGDIERPLVIAKDPVDVHLKHLKPVQPVMHGSGTLTTTGIIFGLVVPETIRF